MRKNEQLVAPVISLLGNTRESDIPTPEEYQYWTDRERRVFHIDYEIEDDYQLYELGKTIIQMNYDEISVENPKPIYIFIHSYGGDLDQTNYFCDLVISSRIPIYTIATGVAMSAGFLILLSGHKRFAFKHTRALVHEGSAAFSGTAAQVDEAQKDYKRQIEGMKQYILDRTSIDDKMFNRNKKKDWYIDADEMVKTGVVDSIITNITDIF